MINLKMGESKIYSMTNPSEDEFNLYMNFLINALRGGNPSAVDKLYKQEHKTIDGVAEFFRNQLKYPTKTLYRGIILDDKYAKNNILKPITNITYLSFSEDKKSAGVFADTKDFMAFTLMKQAPDAKGYIIEHKPASKEIIFHWSWMRQLGLDKMPMLDSALLKQQKEVMIKQTGKSFKLIPYNETD